MKKTLLLLFICSTFSKAALSDIIRANFGFVIDQRKPIGIHFDYTLNVLGDISIGGTLIQGLYNSHFSLGDESNNAYLHLDYAITEDLLIFLGYGIEADRTNTYHTSIYSYGIHYYSSKSLYIKIQNIHRLEGFNDNTLLLSLGISLDRWYHRRINE